MSPTQEHIARGLQHALASDHSFPVVFVTTFACIWFENRRKCLLKLQQQRVAFVGH